MQTIKASKTRSNDENKQLVEIVAEIINNVRERGDEALKDYAAAFDASDRSSFRVSRAEIEEAYDAVDDTFISDLRQAKANIEAFAVAQKAALRPVDDFSPAPGIHLSHRIIPVDSCCCYVPGGNYPLYSSALMLITPAKVAGVSRICAASPVVHGTASINKKTLVAMDIAGADEIYAVSGAQAIAAFAYGTQQIDPVDMIVGPGNRYVAEAKRQCYGKVGIDFVAGPSEVLIIADETADPSVIAADLLAQCEHDVNAKGILISTNHDLASEVLKAVEEELRDLPTASVAGKSWNDYGEILLADDLEEAVRCANSMAPEHLELNVSDPEAVTGDLRNYGSLFVGANTAEVFGDYASGTNHTLPTLGASRYTGGVWAGTFLKVCTSQWMTDEASSSIAPLVKRLAEGEGLMAHAEAASKRIR